jgi:Kef-type K+ transport system membrane component KefB
LLGLVEPDETLEVFAELGVVFLLFWVGLETRLSDMRDVGATAVRVGALGVVVPFAAGYAAGLVLGESGATSVFLGAALVATSVGITSAVLLELKALATVAARTILGAAVLDDILAMVLLAVAVGVAEQGSVDLVSIGVVVALALGFVAFVALGGTRIVARWPDIFHAPRFSESPLLPAVILCLGLAAFAAQIGLAAIIGAFLAGMVVAETRDQHDFEEEVAPLYAFFPPFFFVFIGLEVDLGAFTDPDTLGLLAGIVALAFVTKFGAAWLAARSMGPRDALVVGIGMVPRGEVGIIVAGIGATAGVVDGELFAVIVGMSILTTLIVPPMLRRALERPAVRPDAAQGEASRPSP